MIYAMSDIHGCIEELKKQMEYAGTGNIARDKSFHDIYYDGASHYYIDGSVYKQGKLLLLGYDEKSKKYYQIEKGKKIPVKRFEKYR